MPSKNIDVLTVLKELHKITGFRISLHDTDFNETAAYPETALPFCECVHASPAEFAKCVEQDANACEVVSKTDEVYIYKCKMGLYEAVSPLYHFGVLCGYLMMGQVTDKSPDSIKFITNAASEALGADAGWRKTVGTIPKIDADMLRSYVHIMTICAEYITLSNAMPVSDRNLAELIKKHIHKNFRKKLSIRSMCEYFSCSKSTLLCTFRKKYGVTVNKYINDIRLEEAKKELENSGNTIKQIAVNCGFTDQSYFSKVFLKHYGITPSECRRESGEEKEPADSYDYSI